MPSLIAVVPTLRSTPRAVGFVQDVTPDPFVVRIKPFEPPLVGSVSDQVPAVAAVWSVTTPLVLPDRPSVPAEVPARPNVGVVTAENVLAPVAERRDP